MIDPARTNIFRDRTSGVMVRVDGTNDAYARITVLTALPSTWSMPVSLYDADRATAGSFVGRYVPVDVGDMIPPAGYRPPVTAVQWATEAAAVGLDGARGDETPDGVSIGAWGAAETP